MLYNLVLTSESVDDAEQYFELSYFCCVLGFKKEAMFSVMTIIILLWRIKIMAKSCASPICPWCI